MIIWLIKWLLAPLTAAMFGGGLTYWLLLPKTKSKDLGPRQTGFLEWLLVLFVSFLGGMGVVLFNLR